MGGHAACMREMNAIYRVLVENVGEKDNLEDPGFDRRILLRWIFVNWSGEP